MNNKRIKITSKKEKKKKKQKNAIAQKKKVNTMIHFEVVQLRLYSSFNYSMIGHVFILLYPIYFNKKKN